MPNFDIDAYLRNRTAASTKLQELEQASADKIARLSTYTSKPEQVSEAWSDKLGLASGGFAANRVNDVASLVSGASRLAGHVASLPHTVAGALATNALTDEDYEAFNRAITGNPQSGDLERLNRRLDSRGPTVIDRLEFAENRRNDSRYINEFFNLEDIVEQQNRQGLRDDLKKGFEPAWEQTKQGWESGQYGEVISGLATLLQNAGSAVINNPAAAREYILENAPQLLIGLAGKAGQVALTASNIGYAADYYQQGVEAHRAKNNGALPVGEEHRRIAAYAASLALAEQAGDMVGLGVMKAGKALKGIREGTEEAVRTGFKQSLLNTGKAAGLASATESATEGYQTFAEGEVLGKPATAADIYEGAVIGGVAGAGLSGGMRGLAEMAQATPEHAKIRQDKAKEQAALFERMQTGDTTAYLDPKSPEFAPAKAMAVLFANNQKPDTTPEQRQANREQADAIVADLEAQYTELREQYDHYSPERLKQVQNSIKVKQKRLAVLDPTDTTAAAQIQEEIAALQEWEGRFKTNAEAIKATKSKLDQLDSQLTEARKLKSGIEGQVPVVDQAELDTVVTQATTAEEAPVRQAAAARVVTLSMAAPERISADTARHLADDMDNGLSEPQRAYLRQFSKVRTQVNEMMTDEGVQQDILVGRESKVVKGERIPRMLGIQDYRHEIGTALASGNQKGADFYLGLLRKFVEDHSSKAGLLQEGLTRFKKGEVPQILKNTLTEQWEINTDLIPYANARRNGGYTFREDRSHDKFVGQVSREASLLQETLKELEQAYALAFETAPAAPVMESTETTPVEVPVDSVDSQASFGRASESSTVEGQNQSNVDSTVESVGSEPSTVAQDAPVVNKESTEQNQSSSTTEVTLPAEEQGAAEASAEAAPATKAEENKTVLEQLQEAFPQRTFTALSDVQERYLKATLATLRKYFRDEIASIKEFVIQAGHNSAATSYGHFNVIGLSAEVFTDPVRGIDESAGDRLFRTLAHELAHIRDRNAGRQEGERWFYASEEASTLQPDGSVYKEAKASMQVSPILARWFGYIFNGSLPEHRVPRELYAQLQALYLTEPELMNEHLPQAFQRIERSYSPNQGRVAEAQPVSDGSGSRAASENSESSSDSGTTGERSGPESRRSDVGDFEADVAAAEASFGKTVLPDEQDSASVEEKALAELEETAQAKAEGVLGVYAQRLAELPGKLHEVFDQLNLIAQFTKQAAVSAMHLTQRPLVMVKDFHSKWSKGEVLPEDFLQLNDARELSPNQQGALRHLKGFLNFFVPKLKDYFVLDAQERVKDGKVLENFKYRDKLQYLLNEQGDTEENVRTAMAGAMYQWLLRKASSPQKLTNESINKLHGRDKDARIKRAGVSFLQNMAGLEDSIINELGDMAVQALGILATNDAPLDVLPGLKTAMGTHMLNLLQRAGYVSRVSRSYKEVESWLAPRKNNLDVESAGTVSNWTTYNYLQVHYGKEGTWSLSEIKAHNLGSESVVEKLFGMEDAPRIAPTQPTKFVQRFAKGTRQTINKLQRKVIEAIMGTPHRVIPEMLDLTQRMGRLAVLKAAGWKDLDSGHFHVENLDSIAAQNQNLESQYDLAFEMIGDPNDPNVHLKEYYVQQSVWKNFRAGFTTQSLNQQTSKLHRFLFSRPTWTATIAFDNEAQVNEFYVAAAAALGIKTDQQFNATSIQQLKDKLAQDTELRSVLETLKAGVMAQETSAWSRESIEQVSQYAARSEGMMTLQALMALAKFEYLQAQHQRDASKHPGFVEITMLVGADGKTNGPMLTHLALGAAEDLDGMYVLLNRGGMYREGEGEPKHFSEYFQKDGSMDLYQDLASRVIDRVKNAVLPREEIRKLAGQGEQVLAASLISEGEFRNFQIITGTLLNSNGKVTSAARNIVKTPLTGFMFGSALKGAVASMRDAFIESIYTGIEDIAQGKRKEDLPTFLKAVNTLIHSSNPKAPLLRSDMSIQMALKTSLTPIQEQALEKAFNRILGEHTAATMQDYFATFTQRRSLLNLSIQGSFDLFNTVYQDLREKELVRLMDAGEISYRISDKGERIPKHDLSQAQDQALRERVKTLLPVMRSAYSQQKENFDAGIFMAKTKKGKGPAPLYTNKVRVGKKDKGIRNPNGKNATYLEASAMLQSDVSPGVAGTPYSIHGADSANIHKAMETVPEAMNVHDEIGHGIHKVAKAAEAINAATVDTLLHYSPAREAANMLERQVIALAKGVQEKTISPQVVVTLFNTWTAKLEKQSRDVSVLPEEAGNLMLINTLNNAYAADYLRLSAFAHMGVMDQYTWEGGQHFVPQEVRDSATKMLAELSQKPSDRVQHALEFLNAVYAAEKGKAQPIRPEELMDDLPDDMDPANLSNHMQTHPEALYTTQDILNALPGDAAFTGHLSSLLKSLIGTFGTFKRSLMQQRNGSALDVWVEALATGQAPFASSIPTSAFQVSEQEAFVIEQIEATVRHALNDDTLQTTSTVRELVKLYREAAKTMTVESFHDGDWATANQDERDLAQQRYDFVFKMEKGKDGRTDHLSRFAAMGLAHAWFNQKLDWATERKATNRPASLTTRLQQWFENLLSWLSHRMTHTYAGQQANNKLQVLVIALVDIEVRKKRALLKQQVLAGRFDPVAFAEEGTRKLVGKARQGLVKAAKSNLVQNKLGGAGKLASGVVQVVAGQHADKVIDSVVHLFESQTKDHSGLVASLLNELKGPREKFEALQRQATAHQKERQLRIGNTAQLVLSAFEDELSEREKAGVSMLLRTGAHVLLDHYDLAQIESLASDKQALDKAIADWQAKLNGFGPVWEHYDYHAKVLAGNMMLGGNSDPNAYFNAMGIARMTGTPWQSRISEQQASQAEPIIDVLTTLYAIKYAPQSTATALQKVMRRENARESKANGIEMVLKLHRRLEKESRERLFQGSEMLMMKGYLPEIYNPYLDVKVANLQVGADLVGLGYQQVGQVKLDPADPVQEIRHLYVMRDGGPERWVTGVMLNKGEGTKGSRLHNGFLSSKTEEGNTNIAHQKVLDARRNYKVSHMLHPPRNFDPRKAPRHIMAPVRNASGDVVNYRYLMQTTTKDSVLERDNRFEHLLGALAGSIYDKQATPKHNAEVLKALHGIYKKDFAKNSKKFVLVGPNSTDAALRETYATLPEATRKQLKELWGKEGAWIPKDLVYPTFGYRKESLAKMYDRDFSDRNVAEQVLTWTVDHMLYHYARMKLGKSVTEAEKYARRGAHVIRKAEHIWKAAVDVVKDTIVIRTGVVLAGNVMSNITVLKLAGVPWQLMAQKHVEALRGATDYMRDRRELQRLQTLLESGYTQGDEVRIKREMAEVENALTRNPVRKLIEGGLMPTIVEDLNDVEDIYSYKALFDRKVEEVSQKVNPGVLKVARNVFMTKDTALYKGLRHATQLSDFVARYTLVEHLTKNEGMSEQDALFEASESFVNYDTPLHPKLQYSDDMGLTMFTKYFLRIQRVLMRHVKDHPLRVLLLVLLNNYMDIEAVTEMSMFTRIGNNPLEWGALQLPGVVDDIATISAGMALVK